MNCIFLVNSKTKLNFNMLITRIAVHNYQVKKSFLFPTENEEALVDSIKMTFLLGKTVGWKLLQRSRVAQVF